MIPLKTLCILFVASVVLPFSKGLEYSEVLNNLKTSLSYMNTPRAGTAMVANVEVNVDIPDYFTSKYDKKYEALHEELQSFVDEYNKYVRFCQRGNTSVTTYRSFKITCTNSQVAPVIVAFLRWKQAKKIETDKKNIRTKSEIESKEEQEKQRKETEDFTNYFRTVLGSLCKENAKVFNSNGMAKFVKEWNMQWPVELLGNAYGFKTKVWQTLEYSKPDNFNLLVELELCKPLSHTFQYDFCRIHEVLIRKINDTILLKKFNYIAKNFVVMETHPPIDILIEHDEDSNYIHVPITFLELESNTEIVDDETWKIKNADYCDPAHSVSEDPQNETVTIHKRIAGQDTKEEVVFKKEMDSIYLTLISKQLQKNDNNLRLGNKLADLVKDHLIAEGDQEEKEFQGAYTMFPTFKTDDKGVSTLSGLRATYIEDSTKFSDVTRHE